METSQDIFLKRITYQWFLSLKNSQVLKVHFFRLILNRLGIPDTRIVEELKAGHLVLSVFFNESAEAKRLLELFQNLKFKNTAIGIKILDKEDWLTRWKKGWRPFQLADGIDVVPLAHRFSYRQKKSQEVIFLDTVMSFGTGLHETTRFVAELIVKHKNKFESFLDIGTGTGILALTALKCGAKEVYCVDINAMSVEAAKINFKANGYPSKNIVKADIKEFKLGKTFDFVAANLITHDLIALRRKIVKFVRPSGLLAVSGVSLSNLALLRRSLKDMPLRCLKVKKGKEWTALLYKKM